MLVGLTQHKKTNIAALWSFLDQSEGGRGRQDMHMDCAQGRSISELLPIDQWTTQLCLSANRVWGLDPPCSNFSSWKMTPFSCFFQTPLPHS